MKRILILKDSDTKLKIFQNHIEIENILHSYRVGFEQIEMIYINKAIMITLCNAYKIAQKIPLMIIDKDGYILGKVEVEDEKV